MWGIKADLSPLSNNSINRFLSINLPCKNKHKSLFTDIVSLHILNLMFQLLTFSFNDLNLVFLLHRCF